MADISPKTQIEIVRLCKNICLKVDKVLEAHETDLVIIHGQLNEINAELQEIRQLIDPSHLAVIDERLENLEGAILTINDNILTINETLSLHTQQIQGKQDTLTAGDNITIENNVISATGGGNIELYQHRIKLWKNNSYVFVLIYTNNNTPFTLNTLLSYLQNIGCNTYLSYYIANGFITAVSGANRRPIGISSRNDGTAPLIIYEEGYEENATNITDIITQIL